MIPDDADERLDGDDQEARRRFAERLLPELIKRFVEAGVVKLTEGPENLRHFVGGLRLPKEIANYIFAQIDETKNGLYRAVAGEIRDFLEHTNVAEEITNALTKLSFEIRIGALHTIHFLANRPWKPVECSQFVQDRSPDPEFSIGLETRSSGGIVLFYGVHETDYPRVDQILGINMGGES